MGEYISKTSHIFFSEMIISLILWVRTKNFQLMWKNNTSRIDASDIIYIFYMGHLQGPEQLKDTCGKAMRKGTMGRG
jgi:hypothetical protein